MDGIQVEPWLNVIIDCAKATKRVCCLTPELTRPPRLVLHLIPTRSAALVQRLGTPGMGVIVVG